MKTYTTVILFKDSDGEWTLARYKGDTIPKSGHPTAKAARSHAKEKGWRVRRATNCDA
jgi:hypothetical protein